jgi:hypothetical protein
VLGFVSGGLTALMTMTFLFGLADGDDESPYVLAILTGLLCAGGLIYGAAQLLGRRSPMILFAAALASVASLLLVGVVAASTLYGEDADFFLGFVLVALPLPVVTAVLARVRPTVGWASSGP